MSAKKPTSSPGSNLVNVEMDPNLIKADAFLISKENKSYNDLVWLVAEAELRLVGSSNGTPFKGQMPKTVQINPAKIVESPLKDEIKRLAEKWAAQKPTIQNLHWYLAERRYIYKMTKKGNK